MTEIVDSCSTSSDHCPRDECIVSSPLVHCPTISSYPIDVLLKTCNVNFHCTINIYLLFRTIPIGVSRTRDGIRLNIVGARYKNQIRGNITHVRSRQMCTRIDFSNQCSVTALWQRDGMEPSKVNFKVFNNSKIIVTGMKEPNETVLEVTRCFLEIIRDLSFDLHTVHDFQDVLTFYNNSIIVFNHFNYTHFESLLQLQELYAKFVNVPSSSLDLVSFNVDIPLSAYLEQHREHMYFYYIAMICYVYDSQFSFDNSVDNSPSLSLNATQQWFRLFRTYKRENETLSAELSDIVNPFLFPVVLTDSENDTETIQIENINAIMRFHYQLNRDKFYEFIRTQLDYASYDQVPYQAVNIKWATGPKSFITFLVFQEGKVLISGAKSEEQLKEYGERVMNILQTHRAEFEIVDNDARYRNPHRNVFEMNPRNCYIIHRLRFLRQD